MKILQINSVCGVGSTGRIATDIHSMLLEQGHESYIAYGRGKPMSCDTTIKIGTKYDNYLHVALTRLLDKHGFGSKKATKLFIEEVERIDPDVIHLHNIHGYYINIEILFEYLKKANKPVIWTLHDCWAFTGHCSYFDYVGCNKWKTECYDCPQKKEYPKSISRDNSRSNFLIKKEVFRGVKDLTIVTPSKWLANLVEKSFLNEYPVEIINNGIDLETFRPTENNFRERNNLKNKFIILGVASIWEKRKGYKYFIELSKMMSSEDIIVLVGITKKQKEKLPDNIIGIMRTNNTKELAEIYSAADVFINPTLEDNFPTTNLEALACGTPVITFNTGGSVESVALDCGFIVEKENTKMLVAKMKTIKETGKSKYLPHCLQATKLLYDQKTKFNDYILMYNTINSRRR